MLTDVKEVHVLMGGINYYRKCLPDESKRLCPINSLLRKEVRFVVTTKMEKLVREILTELVTPPVIIIPNWDSVYLMRACELRTPFSPIPGVDLGGLVPRAESTVLGGLVPHTESTALGELEPLAKSTVLGGLVPRTEHAALGGLPVISTAFHDFRTHESRIRIDGLSASPGRFVARVSASVVTTEGCTGRGSISSAADPVFASVFAIPIKGGTGSAEALAAATPIAQLTYLSRSSTQELAPAATSGSTVSVSALLGIPASPSSTTHRRTATTTGNALPL